MFHVEHVNETAFMSLLSIEVENLRIVEHAKLDFSPQFNFITGQNASGKTTLLEAIYLLGTTRSFKSRVCTDYIRHSKQQLQITGTVLSESEKVFLGLQRDDSSVTMKARGKTLNRVSDLACWLPLQLIQPESHQLITAGPKLRRQFLDWGVFHTESFFLSHWRRYDRVLRQRNALLRDKKLSQSALKNQLSVWDKEFSDLAHEIHDLRSLYIEKLNEILPLFIHRIMGEHPIHISYKPGWDLSRKLIDQLIASIEIDKRRGFTHYGAHRAELVFKIGDHPAKSVLSRGQQKMLVFSLLLAQAELYTFYANKHCAVLIDDLSAELDIEHQHRVLDTLRKMSIQVFITSVIPEMMNNYSSADDHMFHVEHGVVSKVI